MRECRFTCTFIKKDVPSHGTSLGEKFWWFEVHGFEKCVQQFRTGRRGFERKHEVRDTMFGSLQGMTALKTNRMEKEGSVKTLRESL